LRKRTIVAGAAAVLGMAGLPGIWDIAQAQPAPASRSYDIPAGSLGAALNSFGRAAGVAVSYDPAVVRGRRTAGVRGAHASVEALDMLLQGTGLRAAADGAGGFIVSAATPKVRRVSLHGATQAPATESAETEASDIIVVGKGYGIAVGTKSLAPLREVPNTVTLVGQERIREQNLFTITDLATQTTGLTTTGGDSDLAQFMSRGFTIDNYLVDGVPNNGFTGEIPDLFLYDRVEILRGPAGLFSGSGSPAGSINLVRKRPLAGFSLQALAAGSWNNYRVEIDVSAPVADGIAAPIRIVISFTTSCISRACWPSASPISRWARRPS
jgi:outer membrane receptor for ferric coprogen and ferric-rhodotorulic acid